MCVSRLQHIDEARFLIHMKSLGWRHATWLLNIVYGKKFNNTSDIILNLCRKHQV